MIWKKKNAFPHFSTLFATIFIDKGILK